MPIRPQNRCQHCAYTWYPRGKNLSLKCPGCGSGAVEVVPLNPIAAAAAVGGVILFVVFLATGQFNRADRRENRAAITPPTERADPPPVRKEPAQPPKVVAPRPPVRQPDPTPEPPPPKPEPMPDPVPVAPSPRLVDHSIPPTVAAFVTDWKRVGAIETRVTGVNVGPAPLQDRAGAWYDSPDPVLRIWVETRAVAPAAKELRRWANPLSPATLSAGPKAISRSRFSGVRGELQGGHRLSPGGPPISDVLLFEVPDARAGSLVLTLDADHMGEAGRFNHVIREAAWRR